jgi:hypothetical protein
MSKVGKFLSNIWSERHLEQSMTMTAGVDDIDGVYENYEPFSLGVYYGEALKRRERKEIYTTYKIMMQDPTIHACLNLLVTAALGGHETRGEVIFIRPSEKVKGDGIRAKELRELVEKEAEHLQSLINDMIFAFARNGIGYGDSFARVYPQKGLGVVHITCAETVDPPNIQAFEQAGRTVGYHVLEVNDFEIRRITKLNKHQMVRMKMQRITPLPQFRIDHVLYKQILDENDLSQVPIIPSPVGGSFLQAVEPAWKEWVLSFAALNSQQIADSVNNQVMSVDMSGMPEASRQKYKKGLQASLLQLHEKTKKALSGGDPLWATNYLFLPSWGEKQILNSLGDITKRSAPLTMELALTHLKRGVGALGLDLSLTGWMELISGGLGDGAAFHTSAQVMQNSSLIRQAVTEPIIDIIIMHFAYKYGKVFKRGDLPFKIEFYSDISAAATESLNNKSTRANTLAITTTSILSLKEVGLGKDSNTLLLTEILGMDDSHAEMIAEDLAKAKKEDKDAENGGPGGDGGFGGGAPDDDEEGI